VNLCMVYNYVVGSINISHCSLLFTMEHDKKFAFFTVICLLDFHNYSAFSNCSTAFFNCVSKSSFVIFPSEKLLSKKGNENTSIILPSWNGNLPCAISKTVKPPLPPDEVAINNIGFLKNILPFILVSQSNKFLKTAEYTPLCSAKDNKIPSDSFIKFKNLWAFSGIPFSFSKSTPNNGNSKSFKSKMLIVAFSTKDDA